MFDYSKSYHVTDKNGVVQMIFDSMATKHIPKAGSYLKISVIYSKNLLEDILMDFNLCFVFCLLISVNGKSIFENMDFYILQIQNHMNETLSFTI
jgi:hypothetical protein